MKKFAIAIAAAALSFGALAAGTETPRIDKRQAKQEARIDQGVASGELTKPEARRLTRQQNRIDRAENAAKADGTVTAQERAQLTRKQNRASRHIYQQKHDAQERPAPKS